MKTVGMTVGAALLSIIVGTIVVLVVALALWVLVPAVFPITLSYVQSIALAALLFLARGIFK